MPVISLRDTGVCDWLSQPKEYNVIRGKNGVATSCRYSPHRYIEKPGVMSPFFLHSVWDPVLETRAAVISSFHSFCHSFIIWLILLLHSAVPILNHYNTHQYPPQALVIQIEPLLPGLRPLQTLCVAKRNHRPILIFMHVPYVGKNSHLLVISLVLNRGSSAWTAGNGYTMLVSVGLVVKRSSGRPTR